METGGLTCGKNEGGYGERLAVAGEMPQQGKIACLQTGKFVFFQARGVVNTNFFDYNVLMREASNNYQSNADRERNRGTK